MSKPLLVCLFHLNLAFSSLQADDRAHVVEACYRPLLRLPQARGFPDRGGGIGLDARADRRARPGLAGRRRGSDRGRAGWSWWGSGLQLSAPRRCSPPTSTPWNLRLGLEDYERLLGRAPAACAGLRAGVRARPRRPLRRRRLRRHRRRLGQRFPLAPRVAFGRAAAPAAGGRRRRPPAGDLERLDRVPALPALRPRRAAARALAGLDRGAGPGWGRRAAAVCQRRRGVRPPGRTLRRRAAARHGRVGPDRRRPGGARRARHRHAGAAVPGARAARPGGGGAGAPARVGGPPGAGQEAGQVQHRPLGGHGPRRPGHQYALPAPAPRARRPWRRHGGRLARAVRAVGVGLPHPHHGRPLGGAGAAADRGRAAPGGAGARRPARTGRRRPAQRRAARRQPAAHPARPARRRAQRPAWADGLRVRRRARGAHGRCSGRSSRATSP